MKFEIINPHDPWMLEASSFKVAVVANLFISEGRYSLRQVPSGGAPFEDEAQALSMPPFIFSKKPDPWFLEHFESNCEETVKDVFENQLQELIECIESMSLPEGREVSSLVDMGKQARNMAASLRNRLAEREVPAS